MRLTVFHSQFSATLSAAFQSAARLARQGRPAGAQILLSMTAPLALIGCSGGAPLHELPPVASQESGYTLGAGDKLRITIYGEEELSGEYLVDGTGAVAFPLVGSIRADGLQAQELGERLTEALGAGYIDHPSVSIEVLNFRPFYILGEVQKPGEYPFVEGLTIYSAVAKAEGFTYRADSKRVYIRHKGASDEIAYRLSGGTPVSPGDTIRIPERSF